MLVLLKLPGSDTELSRSIRDIILPLSIRWADEMRRNPLPRLYSSGIFYRPENPRLKWDEWCDPYTTFENRCGDCDDLVIYRLAEIFVEKNYHGEPNEILPAWPVVARKVPKQGKSKEYHVFIRHRLNDELEDPSLKLLRKGDKLT